MKITDIIQFLIYFSIILTANFFYKSLYENHESTNCNKKCIYISQSILVLLASILKQIKPTLTSLLFLTAFLLPLFLYKDNIKNKFFYYLITIITVTVSEILLGTFILLIANQIFDAKIMVMNEAFIIYPWLSIIYVFLLLLCIQCVFYLIIKAKKYIHFTNIRKLFVLYCLPMFLILINTNIIYSSHSKDSFFLNSIIYWSIFLFLIIILYRNMHYYIQNREDEISQKRYEQTIKLQVEEMKDIDEYYKQIRKENHDFENHCLIISSLFQENHKSIKKYIYSILDEYNKGDQQ